MAKIFNSKFIVLAVFAFGVFLSLSIISAANKDVVYPVAELGGCKNEQDCAVFCDKPENIKDCIAFAEKNNLMSAEETARAKKFAEIGSGPGGCATPAACENYCNDVSRIDECIGYAEKNGLMSEKDLKEARKVKTALDAGAKMPGGCKNKKDCDNYCNDSSHMEECITFAETAGFMSADELQEAHKVLEAVRKGAKPPPCRGKQECDAYCGEDNHFEECMVFAEAAGFMTPEEAQMARKTGGKGPGGCKGKEECDAFCNDPNNQETCLGFARENGLISESDLKQMEQGKQQLTEAMNQAPPQVIECLTSVLGSEMVGKIKGGTAMPSRSMADQMSGCFEKFMGPPGGEQSGGPQGNNQGMPPPGGEFSGPGGCKSPEECKTFCESNPEQCQGQGPGQPQSQGPQNMMMLPQEGIPPQGQFNGPPPNEPPPGEPSPPPSEQPPQSRINIFFGGLLQILTNLIVR